MKRNITINQFDDWIEVYLEGKLLQQGHSINLASLIRKLGFNVKTIYKEEKD